MNKYEERAQQERKAALRFSMLILTAGLVLVATVVLILEWGSWQPSTRMGIALAFVILVLRQLTRRLKTRSPRAAQPDPRSRLNLQ